MVNSFVHVIMYSYYLFGELIAAVLVSLMIACCTCAYS
jgi:hypothetical protein